jgi:vancomycin resistance protein VanW
MDERPSLKDVSRAGWALRQAAHAARQTRRLLQWQLDPARFGAPERVPEALALPHLWGEVKVRVARDDPHADPALEAGKRRNVALAAPAFDGLWLAPDRPLSFWKALGRVTEEKGFAMGMELRGGCVRPALGGGLCLLSNALYRLACEAGLEIVERHGHSVEAVPPPPDELWGLDATVAWPHVDLVVRPVQGQFGLKVWTDPTHLHLQLHGDAPKEGTVTLHNLELRTLTQPGERRRRAQLVRTFQDAAGRAQRVETVAFTEKALLPEHHLGRSCLTCGETECHARVTLKVSGKVAPSPGAKP